LIVWIAIAASQIRIRNTLTTESVTKLTVRMWGNPWLSWAALAGMTGVLLLMWTESEARTQLLSTGALTAGILLIAAFRSWRERRIRSLGNQMERSQRRSSNYIAASSRAALERSCD
jgi:aromatic amino acid permease